ncbi:MAG: mannose-1-phosphate guanylyltransferase [Lentisphaeria bacterium]|nr:mannose-1-phosphate guanylyltransferase [Lentisphaeria bacterium]
MMEIFCAIMAGGRGERLWPRSRKNKPKQLLPLLDRRSLLEQTLLRLQGFVSPENTLIVTNAGYAGDIRGLCPELPPGNVIGEPVGRNTAPCVALAAGIVKSIARTADPVLLLLPSDHAIIDRNAMISDFRACCECAVKHDALATIGIPPDSPSPEYGYIECGEKIGGEEKISEVKRFVEKPPVEKAKQLLAGGRCRWNSGMFVFPLKTLRDEMALQAPDLLAFSDRIAAAWGTPAFEATLAAGYADIRKISVDYAIMEHAGRVILRDASFGWDDIGSWTALRKFLPQDENGNAASGETLLLDSRDCIVFSEGGPGVVAGIDLEDMIIVRTADAVLVCPARSTGKIKELLARLAAEERFGRYL